MWYRLLYIYLAFKINITKSNKITNKHLIFKVTFDIILTLINLMFAKNICCLCSRMENVMKNTINLGFGPADIMLPSKDTDLSLWSVVACDQYTSEPEYWEDVKKLVGDKPSTLPLIFPEVYLANDDAEERICAINKTMNNYLNSNLFTEYKNAFIYVKRTIGSGLVREGLIGMVDLEEYDYSPQSESLIRATEKTVIERIPPRVKIRENAPLELPHIMILIDDDKKSVIEPIAQDKMEKLYDFNLMQNGGHIEGYLVTENRKEAILSVIASLATKEAMESKYGVSGKEPLLFAMGDGNHSLATAKACYEKLKEEIGAEAAKNHPARFALAEIVNIHSPALVFEPIHRVLFGCDTEKVKKSLVDYTTKNSEENGDVCKIILTANGNEEEFSFKMKKGSVSTYVIQKFLDEYTKENGGEIDYIHGDDVVKKLSLDANNLGFILPGMEKSSLFSGVIVDGALPRKTFSMGEANEKRFYLEARKIK